MLAYKHFETREDWLKGRVDFPGIGASEAAAVVGASSWMTPTELWKQKVGLSQPKDLSNSEFVQYGIQAEEHIRSLFMLKHDNLKLNYKPYDFLYQKDRPWLRCTLDGELMMGETGEKGILEIKTHMVRGKSDLAQWDQRIPDGYLVQVLHQFLATEFTFAYLSAELIFQDGDSSLRTYYFTAKDYYEEMQWLLDEETKFWQNVQEHKTPNAKLFL